MDGYTLMDAPAEAQRLEFLISDISRRCLYGAWIDQVEYRLWQRQLDGAGDFGDDAVSDAEVEALRSLSKAIDGWLVWKDVEHEESAKAYLESGPYVITMSEWLPLFRAWQRALRVRR